MDNDTAGPDAPLEADAADDGAVTPAAQLTGNGDSAGVNKITGDITKMAAQVPALFEALSGMPLAELMSRVRKIGDTPDRPGIAGS